MAPCPRCSKENPATAPTCARCGMPLALGEDPAPARLDRALDLDRRSRAGPAPGAAAPSGAAPGPAFDPGRSDWRLRAPSGPEAGDVDGEEPGPPSPAPPRPALEAGPAARAPRGPWLVPAPPSRRAAAWAIDAALVSAMGIAVPSALLWGAGPAPGPAPCAFGSGTFAILVLSEAFVLVSAFVYATVAHSLAGATLGKRLAGIRVVGPDGRPPDPATSARRSAWALLSLAPAGAGLLPALVTPSRRALHDVLAGTRVVMAP